MVTTLAETSLTLADFSVIATMLAAFVAAFYYLFSKLEHRVDRVEVDQKEYFSRSENRIGQIERDVKEISESRVSKEDWLRAVHGTRKKLDVLMQQTSRLEAKVDAEHGIGAALDRLCDRMGESRGDDHGS